MEGIDKIKPMGDRVILEMIGFEEKFGEIFIPPSAKEKLHRSKIVAIGDEVDTDKWKIGDIVLVSWYIGVWVDVFAKDIQAQKYLIVRPHEIMAKWRE